MRNVTSSYFIMKSVCTELWKGPHSHWCAAVISYGSALTGWSLCARSSRHAEPEGHLSASLFLEQPCSSLFDGVTWIWRSVGEIPLTVALLTHQVIMAEQILPVGWILFWDSPHLSWFPPLPDTHLLPFQAGNRLGASLPQWNCMARLQAEIAIVGFSKSPKPVL